MPNPISSLNTPRPYTFVSKVVNATLAGLTPAQISQQLGVKRSRVYSCIAYSRNKGYLPRPEASSEYVKRKDDFKRLAYGQELPIGALLPSAAAALDDTVWTQILEACAAQGYTSLAEYAIDVLTSEVLETPRKG